MNISPTGKIDKDWGYEIVWASNQFYCGKILVFEKAGAETTVVIHKDRKKSWFINAGRFQIIFTDINYFLNAHLGQTRFMDILRVVN